jgi:hypothetical protein
MIIYDIRKASCLNRETQEGEVTSLKEGVGQRILRELRKIGKMSPAQFRDNLINGQKQESDPLLLLYNNNNYNMNEHFYQCILFMRI